MENEDLRELQMCCLDILLAVDKYCKANKIKYFLAEGTLLGAIRHNGFIPWDDDIDILMLREDFEKFVSKFNDDPPQGYVVEYFNNNPKYWLNFAKVRTTKKTNFIAESLSKISNNLGPWIDIFPLDDAPGDLIINHKKIVSRVSIFKKMLFYKQFSSNPRGIKRKIIKGFSKIMPYRFIVKVIMKNMKYFNNKNENFVVNYGSFYSPSKEIFPKSMFEKQIFVDFEKHKLPVSPNYDEILTKIYGDYHKLPPVDKRKNHQNLIKRINSHND